MSAFGTVRFVYCEPESYPLVYLRTDGTEKILIALNPSEKEVECICPYQPKEVIYTLGEPFKMSDGKLFMSGQSAGMIQVDE